MVYAGTFAHWERFSIGGEFGFNLTSFENKDRRPLTGTLTQVTDTYNTGGILLPESAKEKPKEGKVISIGEGKMLDDGKRSTFSVRVGDRILFTSYAGTEVKVGGEEYLIMREEDILGVITG